MVPVHIMQGLSDVYKVVSHFTAPCQDRPDRAATLVKSGFGLVIGNAQQAGVVGVHGIIP